MHHGVRALGEELYREGITAGCTRPIVPGSNGGPFFCPAEPVTLGQTAVFLTKALLLP